jgi:hypothetical protein
MAAIKLIARHYERKDEAGKFAAGLIMEGDSLWLFLEKRSRPHGQPCLSDAALCLLLTEMSYGNVTERGTALLNSFFLNVRNAAFVQRELLQCWFRLSIVISKNKRLIWLGLLTRNGGDPVIDYGIFAATFAANRPFLLPLFNSPKPKSTF